MMKSSFKSVLKKVGLSTLLFLLISGSCFANESELNLDKVEELTDYQFVVDTYISEYQSQVGIGDSVAAMKSAYKITDLYINFLLDFNKAVSYSKIALEIAQNLNNSEYQTLVLQQMGYIHYSWKEMDNALSHYNEALEIAEANNDYESVINICSYMGDFLEEEFRIKEALKYYKKIIDNRHEIQFTEQAHMAVGRYYHLKNNLDSTFHHYNLALNKSISDSNYRWESYVNSELALLALSAGDKDRALQFAKQGLKIAESKKCKKERYDNYLAMSKVLEEIGNYNQSLHFFKLYTSLKDSIYTNKLNQNVEFLQLKLKFEEEEKAHAKLLNEQKIDQIETKNERYSSYLIVFGFALLLSIMGLIYYRLQVIRRKNKEIQKSYQNEVSLVQEKETLLKEVHHRVKNNMQIISSLLSLQQSSQNDNKIIDLFEQSKFRIHAMAMVHEMLYQKENMGLIHYEGYLKKLGNSLITALKVDDCTIELKVNAPEIELNIDTAIPLGLIINEIFTNSIKYGFKGKSSGIIYVNIENVGNKKLILKIGDDGIGFDFKKELERSKSLGLQLIETLSEQLNGKVEMLPIDGTNYLIAFEEA